MPVVRKIELMHQIFGEYGSHLCGECNNLIEGKYRDRTLRKCQIYGLTHSEATDWAKRWPACGMFNKEYAGTPVVRLVRRGKTAVVAAEFPLEGQVVMEI